MGHRSFCGQTGTGSPNPEGVEQACDRDAVARGLPGGTTLVEFVRLPSCNFEAVLARGDQKWGPAHYIAFVIPQGRPDDVRLIDLGPAEPIDAMISRLRQQILDGGGSGSARDLGATPPAAGVRGVDDWRSAAEALRAAIFDPFIPHLDRNPDLLLSLDGDLTRIPFEVLATADGRLLIDTYRISYVGTGRDVLRWSSARTKAPSAPLVIADPDFDLRLDRESPAPFATGELVSDATAPTACPRVRSVRPTANSGAQSRCSPRRWAPETPV